jgi:hypothetical protein
MIFIMAAGDSTRWKKLRTDQSLPESKQEIVIKGENIIFRQIRQLTKATRDDPTVIVPLHDFIDAPEWIVSLHTWSLRALYRETTLIENMLNTARYWDNHPVLFTLGDVVFSSNAIDDITAKEYDYTFYGNAHEIFALSISQLFHETIRKAMQEVISLPARVSNRRIRYGLRDLRWILRYGMIPPLNPSKHNELASRRKDPHFVFINDWTNDIDHEKGYNRLLEDMK